MNTLTAIATAVIATFTVILGFATICLARQARKEFTLTKRPYLFVTDITKLEIEKVGSDDGEIEAGIVPYMVSNHSDVPAIIESVRLFLSTSMTGKLSAEPGWISQSDLLDTKIFAPHLTQTIRDWCAPGLTYLEYNEEGPPIELRKGEELFFYIVIKYRGPFTKGHETSTCWKMGLTDSRFRETGGTRLNYIR